MAQPDLTDDYANFPYIPGSDQFGPRWTQAARSFRDRMGAQGRARLDIAYDSAARTRLDLFLPEARPEGLVVFVHGGFWRSFDKSAWSHFAAGALGRGWAVAMPSYTLCPEIAISGITAQIRRAVETAAALVDGPIRLAGHSAGGHLVARMCCPDVALEEAVAARIVRVMPISPLSDLRPLVHTEMNADFRLDEASAWAESPLACTAPRDVPVTVWVGGDERPAFIDQARWLADAWPRADLVVEPGRHHFDVIEALAEPGSPMIAALMA